MYESAKWGFIWGQGLNKSVHSNLFEDSNISKEAKRCTDSNVQCTLYIVLNNVLKVRKSIASMGVYLRTALNKSVHRTLSLCESLQNGGLFEEAKRFRNKSVHSKSLAKTGVYFCKSLQNWGFLGDSG